MVDIALQIHLFMLIIKGLACLKYFEYIICLEIFERCIDLLAIKSYLFQIFSYDFYSEIDCMKTVLNLEKLSLLCTFLCLHYLELDQIICGNFYFS